MVVTLPILAERTRRAQQAGYSKARWVEFCEAMLARGFHVSMYEVKTSKYITVSSGLKRFKVRFANHGAHHMGRNESCDFFVGRNSFGTTTTEDAIAATLAALEAA